MIEQRDVDLRVVEAAGVAEEVVLAEVLAVVGRDDDQRVLEHAPAVELVEEPAELLVEVGDAVVVGVAGEPESLGESFALSMVNQRSSSREVGAATRA